MKILVREHLRWSDSLLTGNPQIDAEHKELFRLLESLWGTNGPSRSAVLQALTSHLLDHFNNEEASKQFQALESEQSETHKEEHQRFSEFLQDARRLADLEEGDFIAAVVDFIQEHLIPHIRNHDLLLSGK